MSDVSFLSEQQIAARRVEILSRASFEAYILLAHRPGNSAHRISWVQLPFLATKNKL